MGTSHPRGGNSVANTAELITTILKAIESDSSRTISDLALELSLSESRLQHLFKDTMGVGLGHYLAEQRLQRAALLLGGTWLRIKEIAALVGYEHTSSFTRAFERRFQQTPRRYRSKCHTQPSGSEVPLQCAGDGWLNQHRPGDVG